MGSSQNSRPKIFILFAVGFLILSVCGISIVGLAPGIRDRLFPQRSTPIPIPIDTGNGGSTTTTDVSAQPAGETNMRIRLSEGKAQPALYVPIPMATGEPLTPGEIEAILARLPELPAGPEDQTDFRIALQPIPPPLTGETIEQPFPPQAPGPTPEAVDTGPLQVLRYSPEGEIPIAPFLSVTFNQPMVPVGTLADLQSLPVPVQIEPSIPGTWRWLGTKTLTFQYDSTQVDRLPMATDFRVTIPAGTQSATGGTLAETVTWSFSTPAPSATVMYPNNIAQPRDPVFFIAFDQRIDPAAVLAHIRVTAGNREQQLLLVDQAEAEANEEITHLIEASPEGRWLAFKAAELLPADTSITVTIGSGTPSAEGPRVTSADQVYTFWTYAPLRIDEHGCSWDSECRPLQPFFIRFNNSIDVDAYTEDMLQVDPAIPGVSVNIYGTNVEIHGATQGQTVYRVTVSGSIQDVFGQTLGQDVTLTFRVGTAEPFISGPDQILMTMDPAATSPVYSIYVMNHKQITVKVYRVTPADWTAFKHYMQEWQRTDIPPTLPGTLVLDENRRLEIPTDVLTQVDIDLSPYMDGDYGHFIVKIEPAKQTFESEDERWGRFYSTLHTWVQITDIGLDAFTDYSEMIAWTTNLADGAPLSGVTIQPNNGQSVVTGQDGTVRFALPVGSTYLVAEQGADKAILPSSLGYWDDTGWYSYPQVDTLTWYLFDDRQMYRPGEEVHFKGWLRVVSPMPDGDVMLAGQSVQTVRYTIMDPQYNEIGSGEAPVSALGGFDFAFAIPAEVNLGYAQVYLYAQGSGGVSSGLEYYHSFQIQEFRTPEFEVTARNETTGPYFTGGSATLAVDANYFAGGPLPDAEVTWQVTSSPSTYSPPNWPDFTFGKWTPWWFWYEWGGPYSQGGGTTEIFTGKTDAAGTHYLQLDFDGSAGPQPVSVIANASVMDVNRQAWAGTTTLLVHPANLYVGLRSDRYFVEHGTPLEVEFIVTDLDGNPIAGQAVEVRAARMEWKYRDGAWEEVEADAQVCSQTSGTEPGACTFETPLGGSYLITATVVDDQGRLNQSSMTRWVSGGDLPPARNVEQETLTLIPDQQMYQPGDVAQILVQSPFSPAEGLLTVTRGGILYTERFRIEAGSITLSIPIEDRYVPNLNLQVDLVGAAPRTGDQGEPLEGVPDRPAFATGRLDLNISTMQRALSISVAPAQTELEPGSETAISLTVVDYAGQPVEGAEVAVIVVDEAILGLTNYQLADPLDIFYTMRPSNLSSLYARAGIILVDPLALASQKAVAQDMVEQESAMALPAAMPTGMADEAAGGRAGADGSAASQEPIRIRSDFNPLAVFAPAVQTDANGQAVVTVNVPDNLTRYRVMVVAVDPSGKRFGTGESSITARLPLMVRPSAPRFLNFGDKFELPVVIQNQTSEPMWVDVVVEATNLELEQNPGRRVLVPAHDRIEVRFPASTQMAGTVHLQIAAVSGSYADAASISLPVYTPATTEAFATYGVIDSGAIAQPLLTPTGVFPQYGGLEVNTSSTALQALTDAVLYLVSYPYDCTEQYASRILAVAALRDVLTAFEAEGLPSPAEMEAAVDRDIARLQGLQNSDGGFPYWRRGFESIPFNTIHVAHALYRAESKGFTVPEDMQQSTLQYLRDIESHYPSYYGEQTRQTLSAYALYVRHLMNDGDPAKAQRLIDEAGLENLSLDAIGWLWPVLQSDPSAAGQIQAIRDLVNNRVVETAGAANFTTGYDDDAYLLLASDRRTDAILLDALIVDSPDSDLIPKLVNGLLAHRTRGRWGNTQENVFVLLALDRYFNTYESQTPDFVARLWLGDTYAGEYTFQGYTTDRQETTIPMSYVISETVAAGGSQTLVLSKEGEGRLYYRLGLRYAPSDLNLPALDMGFVVQRRYEAVDNPEDVYQDSDGIWHIKAGARVKVVITMQTDNRRYHVALVDPLPAGLEIVNPDLAVSQAAPVDPSAPPEPWWYWWWQWNWYEHQNLRDERAEAFTSLLWEGVYEYSYITRATTPGTFVVPPAKAEEMYSPEVFGRSATDWVIVE